MIGKLIVSSVLALSLIGCGVHGVKKETGIPIDEESIKHIVNGETTAIEVFLLFGPPAQVSELGNNEIHIYKHCKTDETGIKIVGFGHTGTKERCNSLSVTFDKETWKVQNHSFKKMF